MTNHQTDDRSSDRWQIIRQMTDHQKEDRSPSLYRKQVIRRTDHHVKQTYLQANKLTDIPTDVHHQPTFNQYIFRNTLYLEKFHGRAGSIKVSKPVAANLKHIQTGATAPNFNNQQVES